MTHAMDAAEQQQTEVYPPPPPWYKLYRRDADGSAERPLPPKPPAPLTGDYQMFGRMESTEAGVPPLSVKQLFDVQADGSVDFKRELLRLNRELLVQYLELVDTLVQRPSAYGRDVESISTLLRNMHFLLNYLRCNQARASLEFILRTEAEDRRAALADLKGRRQKAEAVLEDFQKRIAEVSIDDTEAAPMAI